MGDHVLVVERARGHGEAAGVPERGRGAELADIARSEVSLRRFLHGLPGVDQVGAEQRAAALATRSIKAGAKLWAIDTAISMVDLTTLEGADTPGKVRALCGKARRPDPANPEVPPVAAVCVYPDLVPFARAALAGSPVKVASVATAFPSGRASLAVKLADVADAVAAGADEVDMVIDRGAFLAGHYGVVLEEVRAVKEACGPAHLKVILETGELATYDNVRRACWTAMIGGADFVKTSTGKVSPAATTPGGPGDAGGGAGVRRRHRCHGRGQGGRRRPYHQGRHPVPRPGQRGRRRCLAGARLLPHRRLRPAQRPVDATPEATSRRLCRLAGLQRRVARSRVPPRFPYAPAPESRAVVNLRASYGLYIDGEFVSPVDGGHFKTESPSSQEVLAEVSSAGPADVDRAVRAARRAQEEVWGPMPGQERAKYLFRVARIIQERSRELAVLETLDNGKPIKESRDVDVPLAAAHFFYYAGWADKLAYAGFGPHPQPLGVAGQVIPWNFPLLMAAWKLAPALATGNTCVLKPAETTPLSALLLAEILQQAELPPGVVNVLTGAGDTGAALVAHPGLDKVAFTGSTEVGKHIQRSLAGTGQRLTLELGGKAANIVFDDAPLSQAVEGIVNGIFFNQGQVCCAGSRLLVQEPIAEGVVEALQTAARDTAPGRPARQEHRHRRHQLPAAAGQDPPAGRLG